MFLTVTAFAKATGDLPSLSKPDLLVLALTYMMEKEVAGSVEHLRATPTRVRCSVFVYILCMRLSIFIAFCHDSP